MTNWMNEENSYGYVFTYRSNNITKQDPVGLPGREAFQTVASQERGGMRKHRGALWKQQRRLVPGSWFHHRGYTEQNL